MTSSPTNEIIAAEKLLLEMLETTHGGRPVRATRVLEQLCYRHPATVAYAAYWALVREGRIKRHENGDITSITDDEAAA